MTTPDKGLVTAALVREILARSTSGYIVGGKFVERADFLKVWDELNTALAPLIEREVAKARISLMEEIGVALAEYEIATEETYPGMFAKLSKIRDRELARLDGEQTT